MEDRSVSWDGFFNARDLGGLPTVDGGTTQWFRAYRSATLYLATPAGWHAAYGDGVRTVVSFVNDDEVPPDSAITDAPVVAQSMRALRDAYATAATPLYLRDRQQLRDALAGLELVEPGLVDIVDWPESQQVEPSWAYGAVARVP